jgi:glycosyltransferase involved in cell wall biosynthesis
VKRKNVLYLARTWGVGGAQTLIGLMLRNLPRDEFQFIVAPYAADQGAESGFLAFLARHEIPVIPERIPWTGLRGLSTTRQRIRDLVARYQIDLIHSHDNLSNALIALDRHRLPCPCVASAYGWFDPKPGVQIASREGWFDRAWRYKIRFYYWLDLNYSLPRFDLVYTVSQDMKRKLLRGRTPERNIRVIHTGLEPRNLRAACSPASARASLGLPEDAFLIGVVGRLSGEKGHLVLLDALARLRQAHPHAHLLIVGTGYMQPLIEARARELGLADCVHIPGFVEDLPTALRAMDVCVLPSILEEGFPTALVEAQMAGLPVVGSDIGGTRETKIPGETGLLARPGDPDSLAAVLARLAADPTLRAAMSNAAPAWVQRAFPLTAMMDGIRQMYIDALSPTPPMPR